MDEDRIKRIFITGATGNIGLQVIRHLDQLKTNHDIIAGVRNVLNAKSKFKNLRHLELVEFDFEDTGSFDKALSEIDTLFLLRPPQIADVDRYFKPLLEKAKAHNIREVMFLSVQGAEKNGFIPHNKIEKLILNLGFRYVFLRPGYFMQNLTTTLLQDIRENRKIILPAGKAGFNWVDGENIGEVAAIMLEQFEQYENQAYEITGYENENFQYVVEIINEYIDDKISYISPNPLKYYQIKKEEGIQKGLIFVMIMLHFLPRFQKAPAISSWYEKITGKKPTSLRSFIKREKDQFKPRGID